MTTEDSEPSGEELLAAWTRLQARHKEILSLASLFFPKWLLHVPFFRNGILDFADAMRKNTQIP